MADEFDVEALLEAPFKKDTNGQRESEGSRHPFNGMDCRRENNDVGSKEKKSRHKRRSHERQGSRSRHRSRSHHKSKSRHKSRSRHRSRSKRRSRSHRRSHSHRSASRSKDRHRGKSRSGSRERRKRKRSLTPISLPGRRAEPYGPSQYHRYKKFSPPFPARNPPDDLTPEERDARTIFCMQLSQRIRAKDLEEFFSSVGTVRDVRLITCNKTRRFKGIAYVEFKDPESVAMALGLNGQKLLGIPIIVQPTQAEKNRVANTAPAVAQKPQHGPTKLYVGSLHFNITENMLRGIFEPFGKIDSIQLITDPDSGRSKGYGFITYHSSEDAKKAVEQMNGFELAGRAMKVNNVSERQEAASAAGGSGGLDTDELDRAGIDLGATGRLQLMYKLAEGTGMEIPPAAASALNLNSVAPTPVVTTSQPIPPIATQCFLLANMFDPNAECLPNWENEIRDDVIEECNKHGGCVHVFVDKDSIQGNVYVKCRSIVAAVAAVNSLHGRWFGGRIITAAYVPVLNYHNLFPEVISATQLLTTSRRNQ